MIFFCFFNESNNDFNLVNFLLLFVIVSLALLIKKFIVFNSIIQIKFKVFIFFNNNNNGYNVVVDDDDDSCKSNDNTNKIAIVITNNNDNNRNDDDNNRNDDITY
jgi:hypothetical protein